MQAPAPRSRSRARDLAAATPDTRNRYIDLLRAVSIVVVVLGHWLMAVLGFSDGKFTGSNLLELDPSFQILTWAFQVMPLFFIVGGFTNATSWASATQRGLGYADWLRARSTRLIRPALWFVAFWTIFPVLAVILGLLSSGVARVGGEEVALPLWFMAVYMLTIVALPPLYQAHRRFGARTFLGLAIGAFAIDNLRYGLGAGIVGAANFVFVWLAIVELGFLWRDGVLRSRPWIPWGMAGGGLAVLAVLTLFFDYPISMIDLTHAPRSNAQPPTLALLALGVWQCGATLIFEDRAERWLRRSRAWLVVVVANSMVMTFYLWNMSAVVLAAVLLLPTGIMPASEPLGAAWWWLRIAWVAACAICIAPFLFAFRWAERPAAPPPPSRPGWRGIAVVGAGTAAAAAGFGLLAVQAFPVPGEGGFLPWIGVALVAIGAVLVRVDPLVTIQD